MDVISATPATSASSEKTTKPEAPTVDYNGFLQLLIAQLKNQDPTAPTDQTQWVSQLASFSSVEQQVQTNAKLDSLLTASKLSQADGAIGRTLTSADGSISGRIASVTVGDAGLVATLESGQSVPIGAGVTLS